MSTTQELIELLRKGTAGLSLFEIEALWGEAATALSASEKERNLTGARFFIDHGQIHDKVTGKHVTTDEDSVFCDGINSALELLNGLDASVRAAADRLASLSAENAALKAKLEAKLAGVDEKALEAGAVAIHARHEALTHWVKTLKREPRPFEASGIKEVHRLDARAAIAAYLAAVGGGE